MFLRTVPRSSNPDGKDPCELGDGRWPNREEAAGPVGDGDHPLSHENRGVTWSAKCAAGLRPDTGAPRGLFPTALMSTGTESERGQIGWVCIRGSTERPRTAYTKPRRTTAEWRA